MSQSGALGTAILDWAQAGRLGLSKFVSLGNKADINEMRAQDDPLIFAFNVKTGEMARELLDHEDPQDE